MPDKYVIVKYLRLSIEDGDKPESDSISHQRDLTDYFICQTFKDKEVEVIELVDDGYTGTNMNRPGMKKLVVLAETNSVNCIVVKDFSRFSRDYIAVGEYIEKIFPKLQIRFVSINDGYDSCDYIGKTAGIDIALKSVGYTMYSRDLSEKIKSVRRTQQRRGEFLSPYAIYGYSKNPENRKQLVVDPEAAEIVRRIFHMRRSGLSFQKIAVALNEEKVLTPSEYKVSKGIATRDWTNLKVTPRWSDISVSNIIHDERYTGKMVCRKTERMAVGSSRMKYFDRDNRIAVEGTHEPIISQEVFDAVQSNVKYPPRKATVNLFSGLVRCGNCKRMMCYDKRSTNKKFYCGEAKLHKNQMCVQERFLEKDLIQIVSAAIHNELSKAVDIVKTQKRIEEAVRIQARKSQVLRNKIEGLKKRKVDNYIQFTQGLLTEKTLLERKEGIEKSIDNYMIQLNDFEKTSLSEDELKLVKLFEKYSEADELTHDMLVDLIKAIYIYKDKRVEIVWNFKEKEGTEFDNL